MCRRGDCLVRRNGRSISGYKSVRTTSFGQLNQQVWLLWCCTETHHISCCCCGWNINAMLTASAWCRATASGAISYSNRFTGCQVWQASWVLVVQLSCVLYIYIVISLHFQFIWIWVRIYDTAACCMYAHHDTTTMALWLSTSVMGSIHIGY